MRLKIGVIFGGCSGEHEVSLKSAASIMGALDREKYHIVPVGITREGTWFTGADPLESLSSGKLRPGDREVAFIPDPKEKGFLYRSPGEVLGGGELETLDLAFPVLHGTYGEDGTVQGVLELAGIPYVGPDVLAASVGMDKVVMKKLLQQDGLPVGRFLYFVTGEWQEAPGEILDRVEGGLGYPCFVKPANLGSSVGISRVHDREELKRGIEEALLFDRKVLVEEYIPGREIEVSVLGNDRPVASVPGEIIPCNQFYDYRAKYLDDRSRLIIPAELEAGLAARLQGMAVDVFKSLEGCGMGRVDFFVEEREGKIIVNEMNTIPGFTRVSMYPKLFMASGLSYRELLDKLIQLALERHQVKKALKTSFDL